MGVQTSLISSLAGLHQDPVVHATNFTAVLNNSHWVNNMGGPITVLLPAFPLDGDKIEITCIGNGSTDITIDPNGNAINWNGFNFSLPWTINSAGLHVLLAFSNADNRWTSISNDVNIMFGNNPSPLPNAIIATDSAGFANGQIILGNDSLIGRQGGGPVQYLYNNSRAIATVGSGGAGPFTVPGTGLSDVTGMDFTIPGGTGTYAFEFQLGITQSSSSGIVGVSVNFTGTVNHLLQHAVLVRASGAITASAGSNTTNNTAIVDSTARSTGGPFQTTLTGVLECSGGGVLTLRAQRSAGTTVIEPGSSGHVWLAYPF
jgi:hypothetical protein